MSDTEIIDRLRDLKAGTATLAEIIAEFTARTWTHTPRPERTYEQFMAAQLDDGDPLEPGTWDDVALAHVAHIIDDRQYAALFHAVYGDAAKAKDPAGKAPAGKAPAGKAPAAAEPAEG